MRIVVEVRSDYPDRQVRGILQDIAAEGSFSHPAYAELQGRDSRLVVEIIGTLTEVNAPNSGSRYRVDSLEGTS